MVCLLAEQQTLPEKSS